MNACDQSRIGPPRTQNNNMLKSNWSSVRGTETTETRGRRREEKREKGGKKVGRGEEEVRKGKEEWGGGWRKVEGRREEGTEEEGREEGMIGRGKGRSFIGSSTVSIRRML